MKQALVIGMICSAIAFAAGDAQAQSYPDKTLTLFVGFPQGGPNDILGRIAARALSRQLGKNVEVVNRGGNSGNIATESVVRAPDDGYTLLLIGPANAISVSMSQNLTFDFRSDIIPVAGITREALVMVVHPSVPAKSVREFIALSQANPSAYVMASTGVGSSPHLTGMLFARMAGIQPPVKHYGGGGPALKGMIEGEAQVMFEPMSASIEPVRTGHLRALGVTTSTPSAALPEAPVIASSLPGFEASAVTGIGVVKGTPAAIIATLNKAMNDALGDADVRKELELTGGEPLPGPAAQFAGIVAGEIEKWGSVIKAAGLAGGK